MTTLSREKI